MNKNKSKSDDILSLSSTTPSDDDYNNRYIKSLVNHNNPLSQLHTKSKLKNVNKQFIKKIDMTTLQHKLHKFPKAPKSPKSPKAPKSPKSPTAINHNYMPDYKSSWFTTENNLSLELYIKHLFDLVKLNLQCNLNKNTTKAILVPHEGIYYSGLCAASAYYELLNRSKTTNKIKRVIVLCTHHNYKQETHINPANTYSKLNIIGSSYTSISSYKDDKKHDTPQYKTYPGLRMDTTTINKLKPYIEINNDIFDNEHSFYTQLPFIETVAPNAVICPLLIGNIVISKTNQHKLNAIIKILTLLLCMPDTVLICSSDLSHINGEFTDKIHNNIYQNIRKHDNEVLQFIYNIINSDKKRETKNAKHNINSNSNSNFKSNSNSIAKEHIANIDELLLLQNTPTCGIMAIYMFSKLLYSYKYVATLIQSGGGIVARGSISSGGSGGSGGSGSTSATSGIYMSGGSYNSSESISDKTSSTSNDHSGSSNQKMDTYYLYPRISCYYTSIIRKYINLFEFEKKQLIPIINIPDASHSSVSYLAMVFTSQANITPTPNITPTQNAARKIDMLCSNYEKIACIGLAREHLYYSLLNTHNNKYRNTPHGIGIGSVPFTLIKPINSPVFNLHLGVFTTLYKSLKKSPILAGCIGTLETNNDEYTLEDNIKKYVILSATNDTRFTPITFDEFKLLTINITILYDLLPITINQYFGNKFKLGVDGILIKQSTKQGYFLPSVATDFNYDKQTLLNELCINKVQSTSKNCFRLPHTKLFYNEGIEFTLEPQQ